MATKNLKYHYEFPHPSVAADCVIFGFDGEKLQVLLIQRGIDPFKGRWAFPGGFMRMDETALECAKRELREETGLTNAYVEQFHTFTQVDRDPRERIITVAHLALVKTMEVTGGDDAADARWFSLDEIPPLAFDHDRILREAQDALRRRIHFQPIGFDLLPETFSMTELQTLYESILGVKFDRRNFYRKMLTLGMVEPATERATTNPRERIFYRFNAKAYEEFKRKGFRLEF